MGVFDQNRDSHCEVIPFVGKECLAVAVPKPGLPIAQTNNRSRGCSSHHLLRLLTEALYANRQLKESLPGFNDALRVRQCETLAHTLLEECREVISLLCETRSGQAGRRHDGEEYFSTNDVQLRGDGVGVRARNDAVSALVSVSPMSESLTRKETQILGLLACGHSNDAMAKRLFISESTVRTHLRSINCKLRATSRTQAIAIARGKGLVA